MYSGSKQHLQAPLSIWVDADKVMLLAGAEQSLVAMKLLSVGTAEVLLPQEKAELALPVPSSPRGTLHPAPQLPWEALGPFVGVVAGEHWMLVLGASWGSPTFVMGGKVEHGAGRSWQRDILQQSMHITEVCFLESAEVAACVTHCLTDLLCPL